MTEPRLRILHCFRSPVGGVFRHVRDLVVAQAAAGHEVGIICDSTTGGELEERRFEEIAGFLALGVSRLPIRRHVSPADIVAGWRTYRLIKELRPDVLHGHGAKGGAIARVFGSLLRVQRFCVARLYTPHGGVLHYDPATMKGRVLFAMERVLTRMSDRLLFVSDFERRTFIEKVGKPSIPTAMVYNGLNESEFVAVPEASDAADLLFIGTIRHLKGPDIFIEAMARTQQRLGRPLTAVMVGDDAGELQQCRQLAQNLGVAIRFLDPMPARQAFALGRVIVVPSRAEALPYIVLEALAASKTTIATAVGGIPEVFPPNSPALVQPTVDAVSTAITAALTDEASFAAAMPSREGLKAKFGADVMAAQVEKAYRDSLPAPR